ncbi:MAG TPA: hypothetical protein VMQ86_01540 [Bryobacteraceae bacterium]|jgi:hypothetical protein|nr:hypothetical protein [Bryobacteraceae bacterium]
MKVRYPGAVRVALMALVSIPTLTQAQSTFTVVPTPNGHHGPYNNALQAVAASSPSDIWAVGQTTIHYDGTSWTAFPAPRINGDNTSYLDGVVDVSPTDAWAAGIVGIGTASPGQLIEHWDGTEWREFPGPAFSSGEQPEIYGMSAVFPKDVWAVGSELVDNENLAALFEHWDGTAWTAHTGQFYGFFRGVSADAADDIWAVGYSGLNFVTFSEHYDGTSWTLVRTPDVGSGPNVLNGVVALAPDDVWAVGYSTASQTPPQGQYEVPSETLTEHYDGTSWSVVPSPNVGPNSQYQSNKLYGVTAVSPNDIWAFGSYFAASGSGNQMTLLLHWDGTSWSLTPSPSPEPGNFLDDILFSGVVTAPGSVWIVGSLDPATMNQPITATFVLHTTGG